MNMYGYVLLFILYKCAIYIRTIDFHIFVLFLRCRLLQRSFENRELTSHAFLVKWYLGLYSQKILNLSQNFKCRFLFFELFYFNETFHAYEKYSFS